MRTILRSSVRRDAEPTRKREPNPEFHCDEHSVDYRQLDHNGNASNDR